MNLICQFKAFMEKAPETKVKPSHYPVYFALLYINNRCGWKKKFKAVLGEILYFSKVDEDTYYKARLVLMEENFLTFSGGKNQYTACEFEISPLYDAKSLPENPVALGDAQGVPQGDALGDAQGVAWGDIPKHINYKHKTINKGRPANIEEVVAYFLELRILNHLVEADRFYNFYEAKGWKIGKNDVKDWKACVRTWKLPKEEDKPEAKRALTKEEYYKAFAG